MPRSHTPCLALCLTPCLSPCFVACLYPFCMSRYRYTVRSLRPCTALSITLTISPSFSEFWPSILPRIVVMRFMWSCYSVVAIYLFNVFYLIACETKLSARIPDFNQLKVDDLFASLGPMPSFSGETSWSPPRCVLLMRTKGSFGISVRGSLPVKITSVDPKSSAEVTLLYRCFTVLLN